MSPHNSHISKSQLPLETFLFEPSVCTPQNFDGKYIFFRLGTIIYCRQHIKQSRSSMSVKRKAKGTPASSLPTKKRSAASTDDIKTAFRDDLFSTQTADDFASNYKTSGPYPHAVVSNLIQEGLLRDVRAEIIENIHFTLKETDIYRIHQSGDLANLSNLDQESLKRLPSLVRLRDALYSVDFREWVSQVTGAGKLSGQKTDMAVNVYSPGSYLLCHDDVIGSRRVSYILYLTDPDNPWKEEWGGGLRLYPTEDKTNAKGEVVKVPLADWSLNIPPAFSQLSFFTVLPGESYHDVEEVYHAANATEDKGRVRMAVSGWFHIPQEGEEGYLEGQEQAQMQKSSLAQLQGAADEFDEPAVVFRHFDEAREVMNAQATAEEMDPGDADDEDEDILTEQDLTFLLQYIAPGFLVPDKLEELSESFENTSVLQLESFLHEKFAKQVKAYIQQAESSTDRSSGTGSQSTNHPSRWPAARPPHKHRFTYLGEEKAEPTDDEPIARMLIDLLHSHAFKKWLALATGFDPPSLIQQHALARRFRRGMDYALASTYTGEQPRLEFTINLTPSHGWENPPTDRISAPTNGHKAGSSSSKPNPQPMLDTTTRDLGGEEIYMAADDETDTDASSNHKALPNVGKKASHDPAIYKSSTTTSGDDDTDDSILFADVPAWNTLSIVLRDRDTMRFVKYISHAARGDRWDIKGEIELAGNAFDGEDEDEIEDEEFEGFDEVEPDADE